MGSQTPPKHPQVPPVPCSPSPHSLHHSTPSNPLFITSPNVPQYTAVCQIHPLSPAKRHSQTLFAEEIFSRAIHATAEWIVCVNGGVRAMVRPARYSPDRVTTAVAPGGVWGNRIRP